MTRDNDLFDVIRLIRPLYKTLEAAVADRLEGTGLNVTERAVLEVIHDRGPLPVPRIAEPLIAPRQFIQKTVNALSGRGLVERHRNKAHARSDLIALTPAGQTLISIILVAEAKLTAVVAAQVSPDAIAATHATLTTMINGYQEDRE